MSVVLYFQTQVSNAFADAIQETHGTTWTRGSPCDILCNEILYFFVIYFMLFSYHLLQYLIIG